MFKTVNINIESCVSHLSRPYKQMQFTIRNQVGNQQFKDRGRFNIRAYHYLSHLLIISYSVFYATWPTRCITSLPVFILCTMNKSDSPIKIHKRINLRGRGDSIRECGAHPTVLWNADRSFANVKVIQDRPPQRRLTPANADTKVGGTRNQQHITFKIKNWSLGNSFGTL